MAKVVKLAQPGYDVRTAADENLIYNSNWPLLKIVKSGNYQISQWPDSGGTKPVVVNHDLGYVPAYWFFMNTNLDSWNDNNPQPARRSDFFGPANYQYPSISDSQLFIDMNPGFGAGTVKFEYYIFALDLTKPYQAPSIKVGQATGGRGSNVKFKLAKEGKSATSARLEDFTAHSDARSPLIHSVVQAKTAPATTPSGYGYTVNHNLGHIPIFFAYEKLGTGTAGANIITPNSYQLILSSSLFGWTVTENSITYDNLNNNVEHTLVILKDPFNINYVRSARV